MKIPISFIWAKNKTKIANLGLNMFCTFRARDLICHKHSKVKHPQKSYHSPSNTSNHQAIMNQVTTPLNCFFLTSKQLTYPNQNGKFGKFIHPKGAFKRGDMYISVAWRVVFPGILPNFASGCLFRFRRRLGGPLKPWKMCWKLWGIGGR